MASSSVGNEPNTTGISCNDEDCQMLQNSSFVSNTNIDESHEIIEPQTKKAKTLTSNVWNFFCETWVG